MKAFMINYRHGWYEDIASVVVASTKREAIIITENRLARKLPADVEIRQIEIGHGTVIIAGGTERTWIEEWQAYFGLN